MWTAARGSTRPAQNRKGSLEMFLNLSQLRISRLLTQHCLSDGNARVNHRVTPGGVGKQLTRRQDMGKLGVNPPLPAGEPQWKPQEEATGTTRHPAAGTRGSVEAAARKVRVIPNTWVALWIPVPGSNTR